MIKPRQFVEAQGFKYSEKTYVSLTFPFLHIGSIWTLFVRPWGPSGLILGALVGLKIFHGAGADHSFRHKK